VTNTLITALGALAALATIGSVLLGIHQFRVRRPLLRTTVYVHDIPLPIFLQTYLGQLWRDGHLSPDASDQFAVLANLRGYVRLTLQNRGREKISGLTITIMNRTHQYVFQVDQQATPLLQQDGKVALGDLQPRQHFTLHIWSDCDISAFLTSHFHLTADNLYKQTFRFPFPFYLHFKFQNFGAIVIVIVTLLLFLSPLYVPYLPFVPPCR
jgi:hypothetical protein